MSDIKPCPFCGGEARVLKDGLPYVVIECERCFCRTNCNATEAEAIAVWNTRFVETCRIEPDPDASRACMGPMLRCNECRASFPRINIDYRACPYCGRKVER